ncbi:hypothetical protein [Pyxidicoccus caerfyrddinensis]|uniref:hypothetical protein n=1 Tax=Pyxidicoccus caerfyrddinensis TaxID=2709663 RepID=UPI0013DCB0E9|nr:hypothetical protein [Pyxidicoccus caerfyrddinensis]
MSLFRSSSRNALGPLTAALLVVLAGCSSGDDAEVCADVECSAGLCFADDGKPRCRCAEWEEAAGITCEQVTPAMRLDEHGDSPEDATALAADGEEVEGAVQLPTAGVADRDVFTFTAQAMHFYEVRCTPRTMPDCAVRLMDASGAVVGSAVSQGAAVPARLLVRPVQQPTVLFVEVSGALAGRVGAYSLQVSPAGVDDHGNALATATVRQPSAESFDVTLGYEGDVDVFTFRSVAGHGYRFTCDPGNGSSPRLEARTALGARVDSTSNVLNGVAVGVKAAGEASWFVEVSYVEVPAPVTYRCRLEDLGADQHADVTTGATPLTPGTEVPVRMESRTDVDVLSFTGVAGHVYRIASQGLVRITNAAGTELKRWDFVGGYKVYYEVTTAGPYYVQLSNASAWGSTFPFLLEDLGLDDHGDTAATATRIAVGSTVTGLLHEEYEVDAISFMADADGIYRVTCEPDCGMNLEAPSGWVPRLSQPNGYIIDARAAEPIAMLVHRAGFSYTFTLRVERIGTDDYGDDELGATPLTLPASASGALQSGADSDTFSVVLQAGRTYLLESTGVASAVAYAPDHTSLRYRFTAPVTGTYTVFMSSGSSIRTGEWSFTLREE